MIAFVVDRVITGCGSEVLQKTTVRVDATTQRIVAVDPGDVECKDCTLYRLPPGSTLLPGFIDCHVHLPAVADDYQLDHLKSSSADKALRSLKNAQGLLQAGFTTLRSAGDPDTFFPSFAAAKSINRGDFDGPTILGAGHYISVTGGGGDINFFSPDNCPCCNTDGVIANGRDQMIAAVRKEIKYGSDWIKVLVTGAFASAAAGPKDSPENTHFSEDELAAVVEEAGRRQVPVMAHAHGARGIVMAANAGCRSIEHASFIDEEGVQACLRNGTWIVPTFLIGDYFNKEGSASGALDRMIQLQRELDARYYSCIQSAVTAGVKVALGSDFIGWNPAITAREFRLMVELGGMTPLQAILAGTSSAAALLEMDDVGQIQVGMRADLVIVSGDPIEDISLLETGVLAVVKNGKLVRNSFC